MRIKIRWEMSGNQFLDLLRKCKHEVAVELKQHAMFMRNQVVTLEEKELFNQSVEEIISNKKRQKL